MRLSSHDMLLLHTWCDASLPIITPLAKYNPSFEGLKLDRAEGKCYVFAGGSTDTIFHRELGGDCLYEYRAWHDSMHLLHNLDFSYESELKLAEVLHAAALAMGISTRGAGLIKLDLQLHIMHYYKHKQHPDDQLAMINHCLTHKSIDKTLQRIW